MEYFKQHKILTIFIAAVVVIIASVFIVLILGRINLGKNHVDPVNFRIGNQFDVSVKNDEVIYDANANCDCIALYFKARYIGPEPADIEAQNTTGYDKNTPIVDELSDEQINKLSYEESEKINEKTMYYYQNQMNKMRSVSSFAEVTALQNKQMLAEPDESVRDNTYGTSNEESMGFPVLHGESYDFCLIYQLIDRSDVTIVFSVNYTDPQDNNSQVNDTILLNVDIDGRSSSQLKGQYAELDNAIKEKQSIEEAVIFGAKIKLVDGWYVHENGQANVILLNENFENAKVTINYQSSSLDPLTLLQNTPGWAQSEYGTLELGGKICYFASKGEQSFVCTFNANDGSAMRMMGYNINFDKIKPLLENLTF